MKGLWAGVSGIIENNEPPIERAKIEIFEDINAGQFWSVYTKNKRMNDSSM